MKITDYILAQNAQRTALEFRAQVREIGIFSTAYKIVTLIIGFPFLLYSSWSEISVKKKALKGTEEVIRRLIYRYNNPDKWEPTIFENFFNSRVHDVVSDAPLDDPQLLPDLNKLLHSSCPWLSRRVKPISKSDQIAMIKNEYLLDIVTRSLNYQRIANDLSNCYIWMIPLFPLFYYFKPVDEKLFISKKVEHIQYPEELKGEDLVQAHNRLLSQNNYLGPCYGP